MGVRLGCPIGVGDTRDVVEVVWGFARGPTPPHGRPREETPYGWLFDGVVPRSGSGMTGVGGMVAAG